MGAYEVQSGPPAQMRIRSIVALSSKSFRLEGSGQAGIAFRLLASGDWQSWTPVNSGVVVLDGSWQLEVTASAEHQFFRTASP
jgi:hypothetical protein